MIQLTYAGIFIFTVLILAMSIVAGTKSSISQLAKECRWILLAALWSQILLLPPMLSITEETWKFLPVLGMVGIIGCGGASIFDKEDEVVHMICAIVSAVCFIGWIMLINSYCLLPLIICLAAGRNNLKWRAEVGLIISVYQVLLLNI